MQVYSWRKRGSRVLSRPKRPGVAWEAQAIQDVPNERETAERIFDQLADPDGKREGDGVFRVGVITDPSFDIGVYRHGMAELSRREVGNQVNITWLRGFWDSLHIFYRTSNPTDARQLVERLVARNRKAFQTDKKGRNPQIAVAGRGDGLRGPYFVFIAIRIANRGPGHDRRERSEARSLGLA